MSVKNSEAIGLSVKYRNSSRRRAGGVGFVRGGRQEGWVGRVWEEICAAADGEWSGWGLGSGWVEMSNGLGLEDRGPATS